jgi:hypothetical protein
MAEIIKVAVGCNHGLGVQKFFTNFSSKQLKEDAGFKLHKVRNRHIQAHQLALVCEGELKGNGN